MAQAMASMAGSLQLSGSTRLHAKRVSSVTRAGFTVRAQHQQEQVLKRVLLFWAVNFPCAVQGTIFSQRKQLSDGCTNQNSKDYYLMQDSSMLRSEKSLRRTLFLSVLVSTGFFPTLYSYAKTKSKNPYDEKRLLQQNQRIQKENNAPEDFPNFIREGFEVKIVSSENYLKSNSGLIYRDFVVGQGDCPKDGQQVTFHYVGYNESGRRIDSTYLQGTPAKIRMGTKALVPGFEEGIRDMRPGGKRRIIIPPELGPPVGPSTFFSSKQFEVFDVELLSVQNCERRTVAFYSDVICN
ncbi:peptidyl-prolyl cis-trans isomerase FKBP20-2, chloroplastic isoform X1 [Vigna radiata var. radiata]|uniref:peptidylprolyl isomerase n=1 Tax=Vigna radiata var. radiata TaxID=3916 RepID=A0A1S3VEL0_VIGRR|nr:peptidyl-prolyl cis-trans isomerase FKBP20-2, chloroplastic isoform X1 [Vigna radiata var. radiata]